MRHCYHPRVHCRPTLPLICAGTSFPLWEDIGTVSTWCDELTSNSSALLIAAARCKGFYPKYLFRVCCFWYGRCLFRVTVLQMGHTSGLTLFIWKVYLQLLLRRVFTETYRGYPGKVGKVNVNRYNRKKKKQLVMSCTHRRGQLVIIRLTAKETRSSRAKTTSTWAWTHSTARHISEGPDGIKACSRGNSASVVHVSIVVEHTGSIVEVYLGKGCGPPKTSDDGSRRCCWSLNIGWSGPTNIPPPSLETHRVPR